MATKAFFASLSRSLQQEARVHAPWITQAATARGPAAQSRRPLHDAALRAPTSKAIGASSVLRKLLEPFMSRNSNISNGISGGAAVHRATQAGPLPAPAGSCAREGASASAAAAFRCIGRQREQRVWSLVGAQPRGPSALSSGGGGGTLQRSFYGSSGLRAFGGGGNGFGGSDPQNVIYGLIAANAAVFLLWHTQILSSNFMYRHFTLTHSDFTQGRLLNLVTCTFSHISTEHLLFNMLGLYTFGSPIGRLLGGRRFLSLYITGGVVGSLSHVLFIEWQRRGGGGGGQRSLFSRFYYDPKLLGASGAVYTLTALFICLFPSANIMIFGIVPCPGWLFGLLYMGYDVRGLFLQGDGIGHAAHLGGAAAGAAFYAAMRRGRLPF